MGADGHRVAISYQSAGQVKIFSLRYSQLTPLATVTAGSRTALIDSVAISARGDLLAAGDSAGRVALWSLAAPRHPKLLATLGAGTGAVHGLSFSPAARHWPPPMPMAQSSAGHSLTRNTRSRRRRSSLPDGPPSWRRATATPATHSRRPAATGPW